MGQLRGTQRRSHYQYVFWPGTCRAILFVLDLTGNFHFDLPDSPEVSCRSQDHVTRARLQPLQPLMDGNLRTWWLQAPQSPSGYLQWRTDEFTAVLAQKGSLPPYRLAVGDVAKKLLHLARG